MLETICASFNDAHVLHAQPAHNRRTANAHRFLFLHRAVFLSHDHVMFTHSRIIDWRTSAFKHASQYHVHSVTLMRDVRTLTHGLGVRRTRSFEWILLFRPQSSGSLTQEQISGAYRDDALSTPMGAAYMRG
jgi:hypothetical protein